MKIEELLERVVNEGASDGFIAALAPPSIKVDGTIYPISDHPLRASCSGEVAGAPHQRSRRERCRSSFETRSTYGEPGGTLNLDIDPLSHPAWTGGPQRLGDRGRVSKFNQKFGAFGLKKQS